MSGTKSGNIINETLTALGIYLLVAGSDNVDNQSIQMIFVWASNMKTYSIKTGSNIIMVTNGLNLSVTSVAMVSFSLLRLV